MSCHLPLGVIRVNPAIDCKLPPKKAREMQVLAREEKLKVLIAEMKAELAELKKQKAKFQSTGGNRWFSLKTCQFTEQ